MSAITKTVLIAAGALVTLGILGATLTGLQRRNDTEIQALREEIGRAREQVKQEHEAALAEAKKGEEWKATAQAAMARLGRLEGRLQGVEAKLAALGPQAPVTAQEGLPEEAPAIAKAMTEAGVKAAPIEPPVAGLEVGMAAEDARHGLGLIMDGKNYPEALERIGLLEEAEGTLKEQKAALLEAMEAKTHEADANREAFEAESRARASAEEMASTQGKIADQKEALLKKERVKKWIWGGSGWGLAVLVLLL